MLQSNLLSKAAMFAAGLACAGTVQAQSWNLGSRKIQMHGFMSQGYAKSNQNNYLTMNTSDGSFAMTDGGVNVSTNVTERLRAGVQLYSRNIGNLSNGRVEVDWAFADYRVRDWLGFRAGKVKSALGLFNDTQDSEFLHTWALLPQSLYPLDMRGATIAHLGGDVYGEVSLKKLGSLSYTGYLGRTPDDPRGGLRYSLADINMPITKPINGTSTGVDARWNTPAPGLMLGVSYLRTPFKASGMMTSPVTMPYELEFKKQNHQAFYGEYAYRNLKINAEYRQIVVSTVMTGVPMESPEIDFRGWFASAAYRVNRRLEIGTYHSRYYPNWNNPYRGAAADHLFDQTVTARVDLNRYWNVKAEGHFMDGYGNPAYARGFYAGSNPQGMKPTTTMFLLRTGVNF